MFIFLVMLGGCVLIGAAGLGFLVIGLASLVFLIPDIAVTVRRLHDTDHSGWWIWIALVPLVGAIVLLIWFCSRGSWGDNRFGPDPLAGEGPPRPYDPPRAGLADELTRLAKLRADGTISEDEFQRLKTKLI